MGFHQCISPPCLKRLHSCTEEAESRKNERFFKGGLDEKYALGASLPNVCLVFRIWPGGDCPSHDSGVVLFFQEGTPCTNNSFPSRVITLSWQQGRGTGSATRVCGSLSLPRLLNRPPARLPALSLALSDGEWTTISASMANLPIPICQGLKAFFFSSQGYISDLSPFFHSPCLLQSMWPCPAVKTFLSLAKTSQAHRSVLLQLP